MDATTKQAEPGLFASLSSLVKNALALAFNRFELASLEFSEVRNNFLKLLMLGALAVVTSLFALAYWSVLVVYLSWDSLGWKILLIMAVIFTVLTFAALRYAQSMLKAGKLSMPATLAELRNDRDALF
jgi:uncharacterized membrane protein YqjE